MAIGQVGLEAFLHHDLELSAKATRKVLAVVKHEGQHVLTELDLKQVSLWGKIVLWWNNSLRQDVLCNHLSQNVQAWTQEINGDHAKQVQLEKQCARIARKMNNFFTHCPEWKLTFAITHPNPNDNMKFGTTEHVVSFDRLTTHNEILNYLKNIRISYPIQNAPPVNISIHNLFKTHMSPSGFSFTPNQKPVMEDGDVGQDKRVDVTYTDLDTSKLLAATAQQNQYQPIYRYRPRRVVVHHNPGLGLGLGLAALTAGVALGACGRRRHCRW